MPEEVIHPLRRRMLKDMRKKSSWAIPALQETSLAVRMEVQPFRPVHERGQRRSGTISRH